MKGWRNSLTQPHGEEAPWKGEPLGKQKEVPKEGPRRPRRAVQHSWLMKHSPSGR